MARCLGDIQQMPVIGANYRIIIVACLPCVRLCMPSPGDRDVLCSASGKWQERTSLCKLNKESKLLLLLGGPGLFFLGRADPRPQPSVLSVDGQQSLVHLRDLLTVMG